MAEVYYLERMTYEEAERLERDNTCILLPMGPLEAHGPHLPLGVDINGALVTCELAAPLVAANGVHCALAPTMPYTLADVAMPFTGTATLSKETITAFVMDIAGSFARHGFKKLTIFCHHLERPNLAALDMGAEKSKEKYGIDVLISRAIFAAMPMMSGMLTGEHPHWDFHAGESETALYLWKYPELVKGLYRTLPANWSNIREKFSQGAKDFVEAGGDKCYFGDPSKATAMQGEQIYRTIAAALADEIERFMQS